MDGKQQQKEQQQTNQRENKENESGLVLNNLSNNPLEYAYSFWFSKRPGKGQSSTSSSQSNSAHPINYDSNLRLVGSYLQNFTKQKTYKT